MPYLLCLLENADGTLVTSCVCVCVRA